MRVLVIEDGREYLEFAESCLGEGFTFLHARSHAEASQCSPKRRTSTPSSSTFASNAPKRARWSATSTAPQGACLRGTASARGRWIKDQQGALILASLRQAGHKQRAVFIHDFPPDRLANLRKLYGDVAAVPDFSAAAIRSALANENP